MHGVLFDLHCESCDSVMCDRSAISALVRTFHGKKNLKSTVLAIVATINGVQTTACTNYTNPYT